MNAIEFWMNRLMWASLQGVLFVGIVLAICRWTSVSASAKVFFCRLAWFKLMFGLAAGASLIFYRSTNTLEKGERFSSGWTLSHLAAFLAAVWAAGCLFEIVGLAKAAVAARRLAARSTASSAETKLAVARLARRMGLPSNPPIGELDGLQEPCVIGLLRPKLLIPPGFAPDQDPLATAHELAHLRHWDLVWSSLAAMTQALFWFVPGLSALYRETALWHEARADQAAQKAMGATSAEMARRVLLAAKATPAFGLSFGAAETERRIQAVLRKQSSRLVLMGVAAIAIAAAMPVRFEDRIENPRLQRSRIGDGLVPVASPVGPIRMAAPVGG